jgi:hypothetical protein|tara:strand:+ start:10513 stop:10692 length:180 start_codon:yes stop_codon:yes gene_type:complete
MNENLNNVQEVNEPNVPTNVVMDNDPNITSALIEDSNESILRKYSNTIYNADLITKKEI